MDEWFDPSIQSSLQMLTILSSCMCMWYDSRQVDRDEAMRERASSGSFCYEEGRKMMTTRYDRNACSDSILHTCTSVDLSNTYSLHPQTRSLCTWRIIVSSMLIIRWRLYLLMHAWRVRKKYRSYRWMRFVRDGRWASRGCCDDRPLRLAKLKSQPFDALKLWLSHNKHNKLLWMNEW